MIHVLLRVNHPGMGSKMLWVSSSLDTPQVIQELNWEPIHLGNLERLMSEFAPTNLFNGFLFERALHVQKADPIKLSVI